MKVRRAKIKARKRPVGQSADGIDSLQSTADTALLLPVGWLVRRATDAYLAAVCEEEVKLDMRRHHML